MIVNGIDTKDISVIVQGAVDKSVTPKSLASIRKYLPGTEIILSTWEGTDVSKLDYDVVILSKDPGGKKDGLKIDNANRQITSTQAGLYRANKLYSLKIRSDLELKNNSFLSFWNIYPYRNSEYVFFKHRVIVSELFCKRCLDEKSLIPTPFHLSDWFQFGFAEDIRKIWNVPLIDYNKYWECADIENLKIKGTWDSNIYSPESYIFYKCLKKYFKNLQYSCTSDYNCDNIVFSERIFISNLIIKSPQKLGFIINKNPYKKQIHELKKFLRKQPHVMFTDKYFNEKYMEEKNESLSF